MEITAILFLIKELIETAERIINRIDADKRENVKEVSDQLAALKQKVSEGVA